MKSGDKHEDENGNGNGNRDGLGGGNGNGNPNVNVGGVVPKYQVKYASCTLQNSALTWWNSHKRIVGIDATYALSSVKGNDLNAYTQRFQELVLLCTKMVPEEEDQVEKFIGGLPDDIQGNVIAAEPTRLQDAIQIANNLMD
uniref:Reverse transcriptase domain-containing protein n=1 Tax=Tanacetum cinerariifolium TaxID=118510 RepID=A0A6L2KNW4_TANCI|nr:hypothetical protein [Tanacetum cinerariifolium]